MGHHAKVEHAVESSEAKRTGRQPIGIEMERYELGVALALAELVQLRRRANRRRQAHQLTGSTAIQRSKRLPGWPRPSPSLVGLVRGPADQQRRTRRETIIAGPVTDQATLHGLLAKIRDLALPLISVRRIDPDR
jgi:hypothetical protein